MGRYLDSPVFSGQIVFTTGSFKPGAGAVIDLSLSTLTLPTNCLTAAMLPAMVGDTGLGGTKGAVPAPPAGAGAGGMFLNAYGQWTVPTVGLPAGTALALNPMTTAGDMIVGGANGATTRLPAGAVGLFLSMGANGPTWVSAPSGGGGGGSSTLAGLSDVDETTAPSNGQALVFSTAAGKWKPGTVASSGSGGGGGFSPYARTTLSEPWQGATTGQWESVAGLAVTLDGLPSGAVVEVAFSMVTGFTGPAAGSFMRVVRTQDGAVIAQGDATGSANRVACVMGNLSDQNDQNFSTSFGGFVVDESALSGSNTYQIQMWADARNQGFCTVNRSGSDSDQPYIARSVSSIRALRVA